MINNAVIVASFVRHTVPRRCGEHFYDGESVLSGELSPETWSGLNVYFAGYTSERKGT